MFRTSMFRPLFLVWIKTKEVLETFRKKPVDG